MASEFADALNELLRGSGISGNRLSLRVDVDPSQITRWRSGEGIPRPENIASIADVFGVDYNWLMDLAYPTSRPRSGAQPQLEPRLAAFLAEIEAGWHSMDEATRELAERGARALFAAPPAHGAARGRTGLAAKRRRQHASSPDHSGNDGANNPLTNAYAFVRSVFGRGPYRSSADFVTTAS